MSGLKAAESEVTSCSGEGSSEEPAGRLAVALAAAREDVPSESSSSAQTATVCVSRQEQERGHVKGDEEMSTRRTSGEGKDEDTMEGDEKATSST